MKAAIRPNLLSTDPSFTEGFKFPPSTKPPPNKVLISVKAAAINPFDYKMPRVIMGPVVGLDLSGIVQQVGDGVKGLKVGDAVFGRNLRGSFAEQLIGSPSELAVLDTKQWTFTEGAALSTAYVTALQSLRMAKLEEKGSSILIIGASGGCGLAGVHLAKALGIQRIVGICSSKNAAMVKEQGATEVVAYDDAEAMSYFLEENKQQFNCVYDTSTGSSAGEDYTNRVVPLLDPSKGEYVTLNGGVGHFIGSIAFRRNVHRFLATNVTRANLEAVQDLMCSSGIKPLLTAMPFTKEGVEEGFKLLKSRRAKGKIVFEM